MNNTVGPNFKIVFIEKSTYRSPKQFIRPTKKSTHWETRKTHFPNSH